MSSRAEIGGNFSSHFTNIFTTSNPPIDSKMLDLFSPVISAKENVILSSIPTEKEVVEALSSLGSTKAPGPDGFIALFYRKYWVFVKIEVLQSIWNFFQNNSLTRNQNHSFIALIPKLSSSHTANQFRPISLCNIVYKIISKILANRLKVYLHRIISPLQSTFVPNRNIQDNTILAHELLHSFKSKRGKGGFMFLKMDTKKAFDKMEWSFLLAILGKLYFGPIWISWIKTCISSVSFSFLLNGNSFGHIFPERGLRQRDPMSPFLFILGTEVFSRLLFKEERNGCINGLRIFRNCIAIHYLFFADDLLMFGKTSVSEAACFKSCLDKYCSCSSQSISASKSSIRFSNNTNPVTIDSILNIFPYSTTIPNPFTLACLSS
jgi:hypothetical protein